MSGDRLIDSFRRAAGAADPGAKFAGVYEYTVVVATPGTSAGGTTVPSVASLRASDPDLPDLVGVKIPMPAAFAGTGALALTLLPGAKVYVAFADRDPGKPVVIHYEVSA